MTVTVGARALRMRVVVCEPGKPPVAREIPSTLKAWQALVGGMVEEVSIGRGFYLYCNENGIAERLPLNRIFQGHHLLGTFFVAKDGPEGEVSGLSEEDVPRVMRLLGDSIP